MVGFTFYIFNEKVIPIKLGEILFTGKKLLRMVKI
jgi:hypothetical protein